MKDQFGSRTYTLAGLLSRVLAPGLDATYAYDPGGLRLLRTVNGETTYTIRSAGGEILTEYTGILPPVSMPAWDQTWALAALDIREIPFDHMDGNVLGFARQREIALDPVNPHPHKTPWLWAPQPIGSRFRPPHSAEYDRALCASRSTRSNGNGEPMNATLVGLALVCACYGGQDTGDSPVVFERGAPSQYARTEDVHELRAGPGWLRTPRLFSDFTLSFDFRLTSPDTEAAVFIRTLIAPPRTGDRWGSDSVYRMRLPNTTSIAASSALDAVKGTVSVRSSGRVELKPLPEWQRLQVSAEGQQVTITLNGVQVGVFAVEHFIGHIVLETTNGAVQFRHVTITPTSETRDGHPPSIASPGVSGVRLPKLLQEVKPSYTADAMRRKVQGVVEVQALILPDGSVGAVEVRRPLDPDLDQSAVASVWQWRFAPATREGVAVPVLVSIEVAFTMKK